MDAIRLFAMALAAVLVVGGIILILAAFVISELEKARKERSKGFQQQADLFDVLIELAKRIQLIYVPGFVMVVLGVIIVLAVVATSPSTT